MISLITLLENYGGGQYEVPSNHKAGLRVPVGGSCCKNCKYWNDSDNKCGNKFYQNWSETDGEIPFPPNEYCSDWWEPR
jgi:hypothetical protein